MYEGSARDKNALKMQKSGIRPCVCHFFFVPLPPNYMRALERAVRNAPFNKGID